MDSRTQHEARLRIYQDLRLSAHQRQQQASEVLHLIAELQHQRGCDPLVLAAARARPAASAARRLLANAKLARG